MSRRSVPALPFLCALPLAIAAVLFMPDAALAWGPGAHVVLSNWLISNLGLLPPEVAGPIAQFPGQFVHGALSPDIFIGKGSVAKEGHSHNWESALLLTARRTAPRWMAYSYGYLSHLAADTVAHNLFVPATLFSAPGHGRLAHIYLEAQADRLLRWQTSQALQAFREDGSRRAARLLKAVMKRNAAFELRRTLFQGSMVLGNSRLWRTPMELLGKVFSPTEPERLLDVMLAYSLRAVVSVLQDPDSSPVRALDPIGSQALSRAMAEAKPFFPRSCSDDAQLIFLDGLQDVLTPDTAPIRVRIPEILTTLPPVTVPESFVHPRAPQKN